jgi:translocator protein
MKSIIGLIIWAMITFLAGFIGSRFMPGEWYTHLAKPSFTPPNWIFAPVWTLLYIFMAVAAWLVWKDHGLAKAEIPLSLFILQLGLNAMWSWLFFGLHKPGMAFLDIIALWICILAMILTFWSHSRLAGALMIPYLAWVSFASALNFAVWQMNIPK